MNININKKLENNVINKYVNLEDPKYLATYDDKQRSMWRFALLLIRSNPNKDVYDSSIDQDMLSHQLGIFATMDEEEFTIDEWFKFLVSQKD